LTSLVQRQEIERLLIIGGALRAGLIDAISGSGPRTAEDVASVLRADLRACRIMLDALVALGVATVGVDGYSLTEIARLHLVEPAPGEPVPAELERSSVLHQLRKAQGMLDLPYIVLHGPGSALVSPHDG
jgi:hypothetical protein